MILDPADVKGWIDLGPTGLLALGNVVFFLLFWRERAEHIRTAKAGADDAKVLAQALESMIRAMERVR